MVSGNSSQAAFLMCILSKSKEISQSPTKPAHQSFEGLEHMLLNGADLKLSLFATKVPQKQAKMELPRFLDLQMTSEKKIPDLKGRPPLQNFSTVSVWKRLGGESWRSDRLPLPPPEKQRLSYFWTLLFAEPPPGLPRIYTFTSPEK